MAPTNTNGCAQASNRNKLVVMLRDEHGKVEADLVRVKNGEKLSQQTKKQIQKDRNLKSLVMRYTRDNIESYLEGVANKLGQQ